MNFLNSAFLAGLVAAAVPLLIHLLNRRKVKTVEFSSVMFLRDLRKSRMRRLELKRWLLLAIRTLMIALAVLAFARPALQDSGLSSLGARARTSAVIALDQSASMALETPNGTAHERAIRRVREIGSLFGEGDEVSALPFAGSDAPKPEAPTAAVPELIGRMSVLETGYGSTDATAALNAATSALAEAQNLNREVYLITDRRRNSFTRTDAVPPPTQGRDLKIYLLDVADEEESFDLGVTGLTLESQLFEPNVPFTVAATITNHTGRSTDRLLASLFLDGRRVSQQEVALAANGSATVALTGAVDRPGIHAGYVEISPDDNVRDNQRHFAIAIPEQIRVLLASDYPIDRRGIAIALTSQTGPAARFLIDEVDAMELVRRNLFDYDAVIVADWRAPDRLAIDQLARYVRSGGGVFVSPSSDADTSAWNNLVARPHFGLRMINKPEPPSSERYFVWERIDWNHPIWSVYREVPSERIPEIRWYSVFRTEGNPSVAPIIDFSGGRPALSEARLDAGKWVASWAPINAPHTDLPLRSLFVPFANRLVEYLAADLSERRGDFLVGEPVVREPATAIPASATIEIIRPDGSMARPGIEAVATRTRITYADSDIPGVYTITANGRPIDAFTINVDPSEMEATLIDADELRRRWPGYNVSIIGPGDAVVETVTQTRYGTEIRPLILWLVAALFFLEMYVARTRRRDVALPEPEPTMALEGARVRAVE